MYKLIIRPRAEKRLKRMPGYLKKRILQKLKQLKNNPFDEGLHVRKLAGTKNSCRLRVGETRAIYQLDTKRKEIFVVDIDFRRTTTYS